MNNQAAYPIVSESGPKIDSEPGLTKLEYFAGLAMQGLSAKMPAQFSDEKIAAWSVGQAKALIAELEKEL